MAESLPLPLSESTSAVSGIVAAISSIAEGLRKSEMGKSPFTTK